MPDLTGRLKWAELADFDPEDRGIPADFAASPDLYLAVGFGQQLDGFDYEGVAWASADGVEWQRVDKEGMPTGLMSQVAFGPSGFVAFGANGFCMHCGQGSAAYIGNTVSTSTDGRLWSDHDSSLFEHSFVAAVEADDAMYVAGGGEATTAPGGPAPTGQPPQEPDLAGRIWWSSDGQEWVAAEIPDLDYVMEVKRTGVEFVALGSRGELPVLLTSADGVSWDERTTTAYEIHSISASPHEVLMIGTDEFGELALSTDGIHWQRPTIDGVPQAELDPLTRLTWVADRYVVVGRDDGGAVAWQSAVGFDWQSIPPPPNTGGPFGYFLTFIGALDRGYLLGRFDSPGIQVWTVAIQR